MIALLRLCRPYYAVPFALGYLLILHYAHGGDLAAVRGEAALTTLALLLVVAGGYALNDAADVEVDRWNAPSRPVASGQVRRSTAVALGVGLLLSGVGLGVRGRPAFAAILAGVALLLAAYDLTSKRLGPWKQPVVAALMVSLYPLAIAQSGGLHGPRWRSLLVFPAWLFLTVYGYELLKDLRDRPGDARAAPVPSPLRRRPGAWRRAASAAVLAGLPLALVPLWLGCGGTYLLVALPGLAAGLASPWLGLRRAIHALYAEVFLVALAAAVDVIAAGS